jgi:hypothetical protein
MPSCCDPAGSRADRIPLARARILVGPPTVTRGRRERRLFPGVTIPMYKPPAMPVSGPVPRPWGSAAHSLSLTGAVGPIDGHRVTSLRPIPDSRCTNHDR